jgi:hypothetical protein
VNNELNKNQYQYYNQLHHFRQRESAMTFNLIRYIQTELQLIHHQYNHFSTGINELNKRELHVGRKYGYANVNKIYA